MGFQSAASDGLSYVLGNASNGLPEVEVPILGIRPTVPLLNVSFPTGRIDVMLQAHLNC